MRAVTPCTFRRGGKYKVSWLNHPEVKPVELGINSWQWTVTDLKGVRSEPFMPPLRGIEGQMIVSFLTTSADPKLSANIDWDTMGKWYSNLVGERVSNNEKR